MNVSKRKDPELASLAARKKEALAHKQAIYADLQRVRRATGLAYQAMQDAWQARSSAKERMDDEYSSLQDKIEANQVIWDEYGRICSQNNTRIDALRADANCEHRDMITCFEHASDAYQYGDRAEAPIYSRQGYEHQARRNELNAEISALIQEIKAAKQAAKSKSFVIDKTALFLAREEFLQAKSRHASAREEFKRRKAEQERLQAEFNAAHAAHLRLKAEFQRRLDAVRAKEQREREKILEKAGVAPSERGNAKIVQKPDGTTQVYHGGLGRADGLGHGHTVLDAAGQKVYDRQAFAAHGAQNYIDSDGTRPSTRALAIGTDFYDGKPAKVVKRHDGKTNIFFSDSGNYGDAAGHGHIVVNQDDQVIYYRDPWQDKQQSQYLIDDSKEDHTKI